MLAFFFTLFFAVLAVAGKSQGFIHRGVELPDGYTESEVIWTGFEHFLDDSDKLPSANAKALTGLSFNGTVQSVMSQLETLGYSTKKFNQTTFDEAEFNATLSDDDVTGVSKDRFHNCDVGGDKDAKAEDIIDGGEYLVGLGDDVMCSNAPHTCGRISCSWDAAIWYCNDQDIYLPERCNRLGRLSWEGVRLCRHGWRWRWVRGEIGELGLKYRVIFGHSPIHC
ncbi:hypothetical protein SLS62_004075 [Diatrype stigma]|uniref:Uncharacterized protein n=1 Tax=Diatrype stigma TaxID=117547 RepID=A0AAN9UV21_9PEZI